MCVCVCVCTLACACLCVHTHVTQPRKSTRALKAHLLGEKANLERVHAVYYSGEKRNYGNCIKVVASGLL